MQQDLNFGRRVDDGKSERNRKRIQARHVGLTAVGRDGDSITRVAVEKNGEIVPKNRLSDTYLEDEDSLEVVSFVGGG